MSGNVDRAEVRRDEGRWDEVRRGRVRPDEVRRDEVRRERVRPDEVRWDELRREWVRRDEGRLDRANQDTTSQDTTSQDATSQDGTSRGVVRGREVRRAGALWYRGGLAAVGVVLGCAVAGCSPGPPPIPSPTSSQAGQYRTSDAPALLVQCMLSQGTLGLSDTIFAGNPGWLRGASIVITPATTTKFDSWYLAHEQISVGGQSLSQWVQWTAAHDQLPPQVCGPSVSASALQKQVFGHDPAAGNPWGTLA